MAKAIWDEFADDEFDLPPDKPLIQASFDAGPERVVYFDAIAVGEALPPMALFLKPGVHVPRPLESTYQTTWSVFPAALKGLLAPPATP
ncbi:MAG: hypothetical protein ACJ8F7_23605 [Gemmataceae bacterium]